jgi:hypothetical protein
MLQTLGGLEVPTVMLLMLAAATIGVTLYFGYVGLILAALLAAGVMCWLTWEVCASQPRYRLT